VYNDVTYDLNEISKYVGFYRKHQPIPDLEEVNLVYHAAASGDKNAATRMLDWKRHCFYVKNAYEQQVMSIVFTYCGELFRRQ